MSTAAIRQHAHSLIVATLFAAALSLIALDDGSYDLVVRQRWAAVAWWGIALAALFGVAPRNRPRLPGIIAISGLSALLLWTAGSFSWGPDDERTLTEVARVGAYLGCVAVVVAVLPAAQWRAAVAGLTLGAVIVCAVAMASRLLPAEFDANVVVFRGEEGRLSYPFGYWNAVGAWAGMTTALCLGWSAHARAAVWRAAALAAVPLSVSISYLTYSRASLGGTVIGLGVLLALSRNRWTLVAQALLAAAAAGALVLAIRDTPAIADATGNEGAGRVLGVLLAAGAVCAAGALAAHRLGADRVRMPVRAARITTGVAAVTALAAAIALGTGSPGERAWESFKQDQDLSNVTDPSQRLTNLSGSRYVIWRTAWRAFEDEPVRGSGAASFEYTWNQQGGRGGFVRDAHSLYLETLSELGIVGLAMLVLVLGAIAAAVVVAVRALPPDPDRGIIAGAAAAIAAFAFGAGVDWLWESTAVGVLAFALAGVVIVSTSRRVVRAPLWLRIGVAVLAVTMMLVQLPGLVSTSEIRKSQQAVAAGDLRAAREHADQAIDTQPWASSPLVQRALVDERAGNLKAARAELLQAASLDPHNWRIPLILARIEARDGDAAAALSALRRARELRPNGQFFRQP